MGLSPSKKQICIIGGGMTFPSHRDYLDWLDRLDFDYNRLFYRSDWKPWLATVLPDFDVLQPSMPSKNDASFSDWSRFFEKISQFFSPETVLIGHSLGAIFLAKYLSKNSNQEYKQIILIAPPYDGEQEESLASFKIESPLSGLSKVSQNLDLIFSRDDPVVELTEAEKFKRDLPSARFHFFEGKGHFNQPEFNELLDIICK
jgi:predicted alpha/beta hydrolase family esterase